MRRVGAAACAAARMTTPACTHDLGNAHDLGQTGRGRDIVLVSRPKLEELVSQHHFEVATWVAAKGVATWKKLRRDVAEMGLG